ncbi:MAG TPA: Flp family type IVb pilin [Candidatus Polarisedimenticolia bacterium]|nr:Flp family type IVb pilin [Candidatus Polarisedimenticolia bacterium]
MRRLRIVRDDRGQDLAEYALLITLISLALIAALTTIGQSIIAMFVSVAGIF